MPPKQSTVWKFFNLADDKKTLTCTLCKAELTYTGGTSAMHNHLKFVHKSSHVEEVKTSRQVSLTSFHASKQTLSKGKYEELNRSLALMCALDLRPINLVSGRGFRAFARKLNPNYQVPCQATVTKNLQLLYLDEKKDLISLINNSPVSITTDLWTSVATKCFMTVTGHFITENWQLNAKVLATRALDVSHTGRNIADRILQLKEEFGISEIPAVVTDNASNMVKAAEESKIQRVPCFSHTLQLAVEDGLNDPKLVKVFASARKLVGHFSHSVKATEALKEQQRRMGAKQTKQVLQDVCTRWNSKYLMINRLLELRVAIFAVLHDESITKPSVKMSLELDDATWKILESITPTLHPLTEATEKLTKEDEPTVGQIYILVHWLVSTLKPVAGDTAVVKTLKNKVIANLRNRFKLDEDGTPTTNVLTSVPMIATALDPRYKGLKFLNDVKREVVANRIDELLSDGIGSTTTQVQTETMDETDESLPPVTKKLNMDDCLLGEVIDATSSHAQEYESYIKEPVRMHNPLEWWRCNANRFPKQSKLAKAYLCIPATEVPSERAFSVAGLTVTKLRASLDCELVDEIIFLHKNYKFQSKVCIYIILFYSSKVIVGNINCKTNLIFFSGYDWPITK